MQTGEYVDVEQVCATDYAARLRAAAREGSDGVWISREDAIGAAAEIEQLWAALWVTVDPHNPAIAAFRCGWLKAPSAELRSPQKCGRCRDCASSAAKSAPALPQRPTLIRPLRQP